MPGYDNNYDPILRPGFGHQVSEQDNLAKENQARDAFPLYSMTMRSVDHIMAQVPEIILTRAQWGMIERIITDLQSIGDGIGTHDIESALISGSAIAASLRYARSLYVDLGMSAPKEESTDA